MINFITTFADCNAMSLPGRMPKMKDYMVMMLPSDVTKANLWRTCTRACGDLSSKAVRLTKFKNIWKLYLPHNAVMKISSDLCDTCQQNNNLFLTIHLYLFAHGKYSWKPASERYQTLPSIISFVFLRQSQAKYSSENSPSLLNSVSV